MTDRPLVSSIQTTDGVILSVLRVEEIVAVGCRENQVSVLLRSGGQQLFELASVEEAQAVACALERSMRETIDDRPGDFASILDEVIGDDNGGWIAVADRLPDYGEDTLFVYDHHGERRMGYGCISSGGNMWFNYSAGGIAVHPEYWRPPPPMPEES